MVAPSLVSRGRPEPVVAPCRGRPEPGSPHGQRSISRLPGHALDFGRFHDADQEWNALRGSSGVA